MTENQAALIYCILGDKDGHYPSVEEALAYFNPKKTKEKKVTETPEQIMLFDGIA